MVHDLVNCSKLKNSIPPAIPLIWHEPTSHTVDCHFCFLSTGDIQRSAQVQYSNQHSICNEASATRRKTTCSHATFQVRGDYFPSRRADGQSKIPGPSNIPQRDQEPHQIQQSELNDLVHDLTPSKQQAELPGSRLLQWKLLANKTRISLYWKGCEQCSRYYRTHDTVM